MDIQAYIQTGIIESYVLGLASTEEVLEVEKLSIEYPDVQAAINDYSDMLEQQAFENAVAPPHNVKERILAAIRKEDNIAPVIPFNGSASSKSDYTSVEIPKPISGISEIQSRNSKSNFWQYLAAASIILFISSAAYNFYLYNQYTEKKQEIVALLNDRNSLQANNNIYETTIKQLQSTNEMMADPAMAKVAMDGIKNKQEGALVLWDTRTRDVYIVANKLPAPTQGKQYQLWAIVDGKPVDAGMLDESCNSVCKMKNIPKAQAFAITLEKSGGSIDPTMTELYVMGKI